MLLKFISNFLFPPRCLSCERAVAAQDGLCGECFAGAQLISEPCCRLCGHPFELAFAPVSKSILVCRRCQRLKPTFTAHRAVMLYSVAAKNIILPLKHADDTKMAKFMARMMSARAASFIDKVDVVMPVPIHFLRLLKRKYNQAALLARLIAMDSGKEFLHDTLVRIRATESQGTKTPRERAVNVSRAFRVRDRNAVRGKSVLLVDDVYTSGATLNECAKVLRWAGAKRIYCLTFAKTGRVRQLG